jgi:hypothetical protein
MTDETTALDDSLLSTVAACLDAESVRALGEASLSDAATRRLEFLADQANEGLLTPEEAREYDRFIELSDVIAILRVRAERRLASNAAR